MNDVAGCKPGFDRKGNKIMKQTLCAAVCLAMLLASCGGGGGTSSPSPSQPSTPNSAVQRLVGGSPPVETAAEQDRRARKLLPRSDSLVSTAVYLDYDDAGIRDDKSVTICSGSTCRITYSDGLTMTVDTSSGSYRIGDTLLTRNGITIELVTIDTSENDGEIIASTLHNSVFGSSYVRDDPGVEPPLSSLRWSEAYGDSTGSAPSVDGTWYGMMTAVTTENDDLLLGDAVLRYSASESGELLSAEFSNIVNYSRNRAYAERSNVVFVNVPVRSDGTFYRSSASYNKIQGAFYGDDHAEATGIFEYLEMLGAFGTKRAR